MNTYVVIAGRNGDPVAPDLAARLHDPAPSSLAYDPDVAHRWQSGNGHTVVAAWELGPGMLGVGSRWEVRPDGLTTFSGHLWRRGRAWSGDGTWAAQLADHLAGQPLAADLERFEGVYTVTSLDGHGHGCIANDPLGFRLLYWAQTPEHVIVSTRAEVVAWLLAGAGRRPAVDREAAASLAFTSYLLDDRTGFDGVRTLAQGAHVVIDEHGAVVRQPTRTPWLDGGAIPDLSLVDTVPTISAEIGTSIRTVTDLCNRPVFELTGGKDSRLVLAHALAAGVADRGSFATWGPPTLPDVVVAGDLIARYGLHTRATEASIAVRYDVPVPPTPPGGHAPATPPVPDDPEEAFRFNLARHLAGTSGASSSWDVRLIPRTVSPRLAVTGLLGEAFRTIHGRLASLESMADVERYVRLGGFTTDPAGLLREDARRHLQDRVLATIESLRVDGGTVHDAIDGYYLSQRLRRWFGTLNEHDNRNRMFPLYSLLGIRTAFAIGHRRRHAQVLPLELMRHACPELARLPFAGSGWPADAIAHLPDADQYPTAPAPALDRAMKDLLDPERGAAAREGGGGRARAKRILRWWPTPATRTDGSTDRARAASQTQVETSQLSDLDAKLSVLAERFDVGADHPLHDVIDVDAARRALARFSSLDYLERRGVHDAATALMWVDTNLS